MGYQPTTWVLLQTLVVGYQQDGAGCSPGLEILVRTGSLRQQIHVVGPYPQHPCSDASEDFTGGLKQLITVGGIMHESWPAQDQ